MSNLFASLPLPALNGAGAAVDTSSMSGPKTFTCVGSFPGATITIEASNDGGNTFSPVTTFQGTGSERVVPIAAQYLRTNVSGRKAAVPFSAAIDVGAPGNGIEVAVIPLPAGNGSGAAVDISAFGLFATVVCTGAFPRAVIRVDISEDGNDWAPLVQFSGQGGVKSMIVTANFVRATVSGRNDVVPFDGAISIAAYEIGGGGGGGAVDTNSTLEGDGSAGDPLGVTKYLSVLDYGAVGDGIADDAPAIQLALDAAAALHRDVLFPDGLTFLLGSVITLTTSGVTLIGNGATIVYESITRKALILGEDSERLSIVGFTFQGSDNDDKLVNTGSAITIMAGVTDTLVERCRFIQCEPLTTVDALTPRRLHFDRNFMHNCPRGLAPPSDSSIDDCDFVCDESLPSRGQAIYTFGQQVNIAITNCRFRNINEEDIQIRASFPRWNQRDNFRIENCHFENSSQYSIWCGSDEKPDIGAGAIITGCTFKNCASPIFLLGCKSPIVDDNHFEWDFQATPPGAGNPGAAVTIASAVGIPGRYDVTRGPVVSNNKFIIRHPFVGIATINDIPADGDTITCANFVYTWRLAPVVEGDIAIGATVRDCTSSLVATLRGADGLMTAPNNALRYLTDAFNNPFGAVYGETNNNIAYIVGWKDFPLSATGAAVTITPVADYRLCQQRPIQCDAVIAPVIEGNTFDDFYSGIALNNCYQPMVRNNTHTDNSGFPIGPLCRANVRSVYTGNRTVSLNPMLPGRPWTYGISDGFMIMEDPITQLGDYMNASLLGRAGIVDAGDGKAMTWLYYGQELPSDSLATLPFRWEDGDQIELNNGAASTVFTFKRVGPGAGEWNDADSLLALINATADYRAAYAAYTNNTGIVNPKLMIRLWANAAGVAGNGYKIWVTRWKEPGNLTVYQTVPQPMTVGQILRNTTAGVDAEFAMFYGGAAGRTKTFVASTLAFPDRPVFVQGVDAVAQALAPIVYQADIIPGVGFTITHGAAAAAEQFLWRVS